MIKSERVIVALDVADLARVRELVACLRPQVSIFKVGSELFTACGHKAVHMIQETGALVFLDLKFHDIPNTVSKTVRAVTELGVSMLTLHAQGGLEMMQRAREAADHAATQSHSARPKLFAVTVLTSFSAEALGEQLGIARTPQEEGLRLAGFAKQAGLDGVIAAAQEVAAIKKSCGSDFLVVAPGIRSRGSARQDQARVVTAKEAFARGADFIVVGRPVTEARDPARAVKELLTT